LRGDKFPVKSKKENQGRGLHVAERPAVRSVLWPRPAGRISVKKNPSNEMEDWGETDGGASRNGTISWARRESVSSIRANDPTSKTIKTIRGPGA